MSRRSGSARGDARKGVPYRDLITGVTWRPTGDFRSGVRLPSPGDQPQAGGKINRSGPEEVIP